MNRPEGSYFCLYRGALRLRDDDDFVLDGYDGKELEAETAKAQNETDPDVLAEVLHWAIQDCPVGALGPSLATYLSKNFHIKLRKDQP